MFIEIGHQQQMQAPLDAKQEAIAEQLFNSNEFQEASLKHPTMKAGLRLVANGIASKYDPAMSVDDFFNTEVTKSLEILTKNSTSPSPLVDKKNKLITLGVDDTNAGILAASNSNDFPTLAKPNFTGDIAAIKNTDVFLEDSKPVFVQNTSQIDKLAIVALEQIKLNFQEFTKEEVGAGKKIVNKKLNQYFDLISTDLKSKVTNYSKFADGKITEQDFKDFFSDNFSFLNSEDDFKTYIAAVSGKPELVNDKNLTKITHEFFTNKNGEYINSTKEAFYGLINEEITNIKTSAPSTLDQKSTEITGEISTNNSNIGEPSGIANMLEGLTTNFPQLKGLLEMIQGLLESFGLFGAGKKDKEETTKSVEKPTTTDNTPPLLQQVTTPDMGQVLSLSGMDPSQFNVGSSYNNVYTGNSGQLSAGTGVNGAAVKTAAVAGVPGQ